MPEVSARLRDVIGESVALVKVQHEGHTLGHLVTLCAEHADLWRLSEGG